MVEPFPSQPAPIPIGDLVPGQPPVPITVWHLAPPHGSDTMSAALGVRIVANYTHPGDLVVDLTTGPNLARAVLGARRRHTDHLDADDAAALIVCPWPLPDPETALFRHAADGLPPGGCLIVIITGSDPVIQPAVINTAHRTGLAYLQHIVAATHLAAPLGPPDESGRHLRVHTDVLVFTRTPGGRHG